MLSSNFSTLAYAETRGAELRREAAKSRLAKRVERTSRQSATRPPVTR